MKRKWKLGIIILVILVILAAGIWGVIRTTSDSFSTTVYGKKVSEIMQEGAIGMTGCYNGVVEPQGLKKIGKDMDVDIGELFVEEGQEVKEGELLFIYDTKIWEQNLEQTKLELEGIRNQINELTAQKEELEKEKALMPSESQSTYTLQIQSIELDIKTQQFEQRVADTKIAELEERISQAKVVSPVSGTIGSIDRYADEEESFITVIKEGAYRIKGTLQEYELLRIKEGTPMTVYLRADQTKTWKGTVSIVSTEPKKDDAETTLAGENDYEYVTYYDFFVELSDSSGLVLGQHVYLEEDTEGMDIADSIRIPDYYVVWENDDAYVWTANEEWKLEKRHIRTGNYNENRYEYEVLEGLSAEDILVFPEGGMQSGDNVILQRTGKKVAE